MSERLSVIVPVYNAADYLSRCLDALLNQGVENYEIVCVNDGSTDSSGALLREYWQKNPQIIRIVEQENQGLPAARNAGLAVADGTIIAFCDADDYLIPHAYGYLLRECWKEGLDMLKFNSITLDQYVQKSWTETNEVSGSVVYEGDGFTYIRERHPNFSFVWSYLYSASFLRKNQLKFRPFKQCEDVAFNLDAYMCNPRVMQVTSNLYRYMVSPGQVTRIRNPRHMRIVVQHYVGLFENMTRYIKEKPEVSDALRLYREQEMVPCMSRILTANYNKEEFISVRGTFRHLDMLPLKQMNKAGRVINLLMANYVMYAMGSFLYRKIFLPYVLPRLGRN